MLCRDNKEWNIVIWDNIDGSIKYYTKWNKSGRDRKIWYGFTYMWNLKNKQTKKGNKNRLIETVQKEGNIVNSIVISLHGDRW